MQIAPIQVWIEGLYQIPAEIAAEDYLITQDILSDFLGAEHPLRHAEEVVVYKMEGENIDIGFYLAPNILSLTADAGPESIHGTMTTIEGVSHLLLLLYRLRQDTELTHLELELQAEIDKFLYSRLNSNKDYGDFAKLHLQQEANLATLDDAQRESYAMSRRLAYQYCMHLEKNYLSERHFDSLLPELRGFYRMSHWQKLKHIQKKLSSPIY